MDFSLSLIIFIVILLLILPASGFLGQIKSKSLKVVKIVKSGNIFDIYLDIPETEKERCEFITIQNQNGLVIKKHYLNNNFEYLSIYRSRGETYYICLHDRNKNIVSSKLLKLKKGNLQ